MKLNLGKSHMKPLLNHSTLDPVPLPCHNSLQGSKLSLSSRNSNKSCSPRHVSFLLEKLISSPIRIRRKTVSKPDHQEISTEVDMLFERSNSKGYSPDVSNVGIQIDTISTSIKLRETDLRLNSTLPSNRPPNIYDLNQHAFEESPGNKRRSSRPPLHTHKRTVLQKQPLTRLRQRYKEPDAEISTQESNGDEKPSRDIEMKPIHFEPVDFSEIAVATSPMSLLKLPPFERFLKSRSSSVRKGKSISSYHTNNNKETTFQVRVSTSYQASRQTSERRRNVSEIF